MSQVRSIAEDISRLSPAGKLRLAADLLDQAADIGKVDRPRAVRLLGVAEPLVSEVAAELRLVTR